MGSKPHSYEEATSEEEIREAKSPGKLTIKKNKVRIQEEKKTNIAIHSGREKCVFQRQCNRIEKQNKAKVRK